MRWGGWLERQQAGGGCFGGIEGRAHRTRHAPPQRPEGHLKLDDFQDLGVPHGVDLLGRLAAHEPDDQARHTGSWWAGQTVAARDTPRERSERESIGTSL